MVTNFSKVIGILFLIERISQHFTFSHKNKYSKQQQIFHEDIDDDDIFLHFHIQV